MKIGIVGAGGSLGSSLTKLVLMNNHKPLLSFSNVTNEKNKIFTKTTKYIVPESDILFLCVKPKDIEDVLKEINSYPRGNFMIVSCVACVPLKFIESKLNKNCKVARIMPNLPIENGKGVITYFPSLEIKLKEHNLLMDILKGPKLFEVFEEDELELSTALTGSMPAFIAEIVKSHLHCFQPNFSEEKAKELYIATMEGTMEMLKTQSPEEIIKNVSSPGGITEKGIKKLRELNIDSIIHESVVTSVQTLIKLKEEYHVSNKN
jgi:pyrroline-5-carboxylate reductase